MRSKLLGLSFMGALVAILACNQQITIAYKQLGACTVNETQTNQAWVFFRIDGIDNSTTSSFSFAPTDLYTPGQPAGHGQVDELASLMYAGLFPGVLGVIPQTVAPGNTVPLGQLAVMLVQTDAANGPSEAANTSYFLDYMNSPGGIIMDKENSSQTSWPYTPSCSDINVHQ